MKPKKIVLISVYFPESGCGELLEHPPVGIAYLSNI